MDSARHSREPARPPRTLILLASVTLAAGTGAAMWALPSAPPGGWGPASSGGHTRTSSSPETLVAASQAVAPPPSPADDTPPGDTPPGDRLSADVLPRYRGFLDAAGPPRPGLPRAGVRSFTIGHVVAGSDGCSPLWSGVAPGGGGPVLARIERLRDDGGQVWPSFGGPSGPEPSVTCADPARLLDAYRRVVAALHAPGADFEAGNPDEVVAHRRAAAIARLQRERRARGRPLRVTFTLPASRYGLEPADRDMLRAAREKGVQVESVGLLVPFTLRSGGLHELAVAVRAARPQIAAALGVPPDGAWRRMGLLPVLSHAGDLTRDEAARLAAFRERNGLAWLSLRGADPPEEVVRILTRESTSRGPA